MSDAEDALRLSWIAEQRHQSAAAIFIDDLSFSIAVLAKPAAQDSESNDPVRPTVHHESPGVTSFEGLMRVGGLDISFRADSDGGEGIATLVVLSWPSLVVLKEISRAIVLEEPYISSFLSFRESSPFASLVLEYHASLGEAEAHEKIQLLWVDGNGRLHEREAGSAVVVGLKTGIPTIGIGKEYHPAGPPPPPSPSPPPNHLSYPVDFRSSQKGMKKACQALLVERGDWISLHGSQNPSTNIGAALLSSPVKGSTNPIFVSPGHRISLESSVSLTLAACRNARVPEPVRIADAVSRAEAIKRWSPTT